MKEIRIKVEAKIYPIGQRGTIIANDLIDEIRNKTNAKKLIENVVWRLDNICIEDKFAIIEAYYDIENNEIILHLTDIKNLPCKYNLKDCIHQGSKTCNDCFVGNLYDDENK